MILSQIIIIIVNTEIKMPNSYVAWIQANDALAKCMGAQKVEAFQAMSAADQEGVCRTEANAVRDLLTNDSVSFRNLLDQRIASLKAAQQ